MSRPTVEVADLLRACGARFVEQHQRWLSFQQLKVLRAVARCRTEALGGHVDTCSACDYSTISYNSCRNRHGPKCQAQARERWLTARQQELLEVPYFHVVFTLPHPLNRLCRDNAQLLYNLLFRTVAETMLEVAADARHLGARLGFLAILHTWGQTLQLHPHLHCVVPGGGLSPNGQQWMAPRSGFFLPVKVLGRVFRGKFVAGLKRAFRRRQLRLMGHNAVLAKPQAFAAFLRTLFQQDWGVYAKPSFGGPAQVLRYLGRYTHRVAISNHRLLAFDGERVRFRWKDYAHGNKQRVMTLTAEEFLRRYVQHVLPHGFVRIRQFGFLANSQRTLALDLIRGLLNKDRPIRQFTENIVIPSGTGACPRCGRPMRIGPSLNTQQLRSRCRAFDSS
jgi:Putative transposase/Transposase zinc-binding domain